MTQNTLVYGDCWKIATYGHCTDWMFTDTQSNSFIYFANRCTVSSCIVSISNQCTSSQFLWWMLQPCFVLKSWPQKKQKNFSSSALSSRSSSIFVSRFRLLAMCLPLPANSNNCIFTIFIESEISNVIPNALLGIPEQFKAKVVSIMQISYRLCLQVKPQWKNAKSQYV